MKVRHIENKSSCIIIASSGMKEEIILEMLAYSYKSTAHSNQGCSKLGTH